IWPPVLMMSSEAGGALCFTGIIGIVSNKVVCDCGVTLPLPTTPETADVVVAWKVDSSPISATVCVVALSKTVVVGDSLGSCGVLPAAVRVVVGLALLS